jgi:hypothetical protein
MPFLVRRGEENVNLTGASERSGNEALTQGWQAAP